MKFIRLIPVLLGSLVIVACGQDGEAQSTADTGSSIKPASTATKAANDALLEYLPFDDRRDYENAERGFIASIDSGRIESDGNVVYDMKQFDFLTGDAPDSVNPSLWRVSELNAKAGLYEVGEGIFQIRAFDLANMSFIRGDKGWIVVDPLTANETAEAGYALVKQHVEDAPITAVIFTHSHVDHFGGVKGLVSDEQVESGDVAIIAPEHFLPGINDLFR